MKVSIRLLTGTVFVAGLLATFQNCSDSSSAPESASNLSASDQPTYSGSPGGSTPPDWNDLRETSCAYALSKNSVLDYDSVPDSGSAPVRISSLASPVSVENISSISDLRPVDARVSSRSLASYIGFRSANLSINTISLGRLGGFNGDLGSKVLVLARSINIVDGFTISAFCASAQRIGSISGFTTDSFWLSSRMENGQRGTLDLIEYGTTPWYQIRNFDIKKIRGSAGQIVLRNSSLQSLEGVSTSVHLFDSTLDTVETSAGTIYLYGSSSVKNPGGMQVIRR